MNFAKERLENADVDITSTMIISIVRLRGIFLISPIDSTYSSGYLTLWSFAEPAIGMTVACAPLMRPLLSRTRISDFFSIGNSRKKRSMSHFEPLEESKAVMRRLPGHSLLVTTSNSGGKADAESWTDDQGITVKRESQTDCV